jgi:uncharacterized protein YjbI with pentapeptide repeats
MNRQRASQLSLICICSLGALLVLAMLYLPSLYVAPLTKRMIQLEKYLKTLPVNTAASSQPARVNEYALLFKLDKEIIDSKNAFRSALAQGIGGLLLFGTAYISWRTLRSQNEKQVAERFSKGVEQLGSENIHVRLGGIFTLEQIANDSGMTYYRQVVECLTSFLRERAPYAPLLSTHKESSEQMQEQGGIDEIELVLRGVPELRTDIQAAIFVLSRRKYSYGSGEDFRLDLRATDLHHIEFPPHSNFDGCLFTGGNLNSSILSGVSLSHADFSYTRLERVAAEEAILENAKLVSSKMQLANLSRSRMSKASLCGADMTRVVAVDADLANADLSNANLSKARLERTILDSAIMVETNLTNANLTACSIAGAKILADLSACKGLTGRQLRMARIDKSVIEKVLNDQQRQSLADEK